MTQVRKQTFKGKTVLKMDLSIAIREKIKTTTVRDIESQSLISEIVGGMQLIEEVRRSV